MAIVKYTSVLRRDIGKDQESIKASNLAELFAELETQYGGVIEPVKADLIIFINGTRTVREDAPLTEGDEVILLLPVTGG